MKTLAIIYCLFLLQFCFQTTFLIVSSAHEVDLIFILVNLASVILFILTVYFISQYYRKGAGFLGMQLLLVLDLVVFGYYTYDVFNHGDAKSLLSLQPLVGLVLGGIVAAYFWFFKTRGLIK